MENFNSTSIKKETEPRQRALIIEPSPEIRKIYERSLDGVCDKIDFVFPEEAILYKYSNVKLIILELPDYKPEEFILKLRDLYPDTHILVATNKKNILSATKNIPNVSVILKPYKKEEMDNVFEGEIQNFAAELVLSQIEKIPPYSDTYLKRGNA